MRHARLGLGGLVALVLATMAPARQAMADLPRGAPTDEWLRRGGAVLFVQVAPSEARVELDGDPLHAGPCLVTPGQHLLVARAAGMAEHRQVLHVPIGRRTTVRVALSARPATGRLDLRVTPVRARVLVDGAPAGETGRPLVLRAGRHRIQLVAAGFRTARRIVRIPRGATLTLRLRLVPVHRRHRRPRVA